MINCADINIYGHVCYVYSLIVMTGMLPSAACCTKTNLTSHLTAPRSLCYAIIWIERNLHINDMESVLIKTFVNHFIKVYNATSSSVLNQAHFFKTITFMAYHIKSHTMKSHLITHHILFHLIKIHHFSSYRIKMHHISSHCIVM